MTFFKLTDSVAPATPIVEHPDTTANGRALSSPQREPKAAARTAIALRKDPADDQFEEF